MADNQTQEGSTTAIEKKTKSDMIKCKIHSLSLVDKKSPVFVSINNYMADIPQNVEVILPKHVVKFLKTASKAVHVVKGKKTVTEYEPLYSVDMSL